MKFSRNRLYIHIPVYRLLKRLDEFFSLGLNCEIYIDSDFIDGYSAKDIEAINSGFEKHGLSKILHGPFIDLNPGSSDERIRGLSLERFLKALEICCRLKAKSMTVHSHFEPVFYGRHFDEWLNNSKGVWTDLSKEAQGKGVSVYIENSVDHDPSAVIAILKNHNHLGACFDVAHYNIFNPAGWKDALAKYTPGSIKEVHLSDNRGDEDSHLALGEGSIDFDEFFREIEERNEYPVFTIEPHTQDGLLRSLEFIKRYTDED